jgi:large subunit ribosomal protein L1
MEKDKVIKVLEELRKEKKKNFNQSVDLLINLKEFDIKKDNVNLFLALPHKTKEVSVAAFLNKKSPVVTTIVKEEFDRYKDKKKAKAVSKGYDFFISAANLMPQVATVFGRFLGPQGKMPSPQLGIVTDESEAKLKEIIARFEKIVRVKSKEPSLKFSVGKEDMKDEEIADNVVHAYNTILNALPRKKENIKNVLIKFTMSKPVRIE